MKFRKKPLLFDAIQILPKSKDSLLQFLGKDAKMGWYEKDCSMTMYSIDELIVAKQGNWILKGIHGGFYGLDTELLEQQYDKVE